MGSNRESLLKEFGTALRKRREAASISQEKLAELADLHRTYVGAVERGEKNVSLVNLDKFARALKIELNELVTF